MWGLFLAIAAAIVTASCSGGSGAAKPTPAPRADLMIVNARVYTGDPARPWVESIAIRGDRIVEASAAERVIDAGGRVVIPGINDAHTHPPGIPGDNFVEAKTSGDGASGREILDAVAAAAAGAPAGAWIYGNLGTGAIDDPELVPAALDKASPAHPVMLINFAGHIEILNTAALTAVGLTVDSVVPHGEVRDRRHLLEYAVFAASRAHGKAQSDDALVAEIDRFSAEMAGYGITTVQAMPFIIDHRRLLALLERAKPTIRWRVMRVPSEVVTIDDLRAVDPAARVSLSGTKYVIDGTPVERGAALFDDYADRPGEKGRLNFSRAEITAMMTEALRTGDQLHLHVAGDLALDTVLDLMEETGGPAAWHAQRLVIEHGYVLGAEDFDRARALGVVVVHNPSHVMLPEILRTRLGADRLAAWFHVRDILAAGIPLAFGSDGPPNPFLNMMFVTTRPDAPSQAITPEQALAAYTTGAAYDERVEADKGRLVPGMLADLAVLSGDPFTATPDALPAIHSELTLVGGAIVHDTGALTHDAAPRLPPDAAVGDFTNVTGPVDGLWPGMTVEAARAFLDAAGVAFKETSRNAKRPHYIVTAIDGWQATLYFDEGYDFIPHILLQSPTVAVEADALAIVERAAAPYGPAAEQRHQDGADGSWSDEVRTWRNDRSTLELRLHASHARDGTTTWTVFANWSRPE